MEGRQRNSNRPNRLTVPARPQSNNRGYRANSSRAGPHGGATAALNGVLSAAVNTASSTERARDHSSSSLGNNGSSAMTVPNTLEVSGAAICSVGLAMLTTGNTGALIAGIVILITGALMTTYGVHKKSQLEREQQNRRRQQRAEVNSRMGLHAPPRRLERRQDSVSSSLNNNVSGRNSPQDSGSEHSNGDSEGAILEQSAGRGGYYPMRAGEHASSRQAQAPLRAMPGPHTPYNDSRESSSRHHARDPAHYTLTSNGRRPMGLGDSGYGIGGRPRASTAVLAYDVNCSNSGNEMDASGGPLRTSNLALRAFSPQRRSTGERPAGSARGYCNQDRGYSAPASSHQVFYAGDRGAGHVSHDSHGGTLQQQGPMARPSARQWTGYNPVTAVMLPHSGGGYPTPFSSYQQSESYGSALGYHHSPYRAGDHESMASRPPHAVGSYHQRHYQGPNSGASMPPPSAPWVPSTSHYADGVYPDYSSPHQFGTHHGFQSHDFGGGQYDVCDGPGSSRHLAPPANALDGTESTHDSVSSREDNPSSKAPSGVLHVTSSAAGIARSESNVTNVTAAKSLSVAPVKDQGVSVS